MTILASVNIAAATDTALTPISGGSKTVNILLVNRNSSGSVPVSIALVPSGGTLGLQHWVEFKVPLGAAQVLERGGIPLDNGDTVYVRADLAGVSATMVGLQ